MSAVDEAVGLRCGLTLPNRLVVAPLTNRQSNADGTLGQAELAWLVARARGGFGSVLTCAAYVSDEGKAWGGQLGAASDEHIEGLGTLARALRTAGSVPLVQLFHGGRLATLAPESRLSTCREPGVREATPADLDRVVQDFVRAALRVQAAGFDGVEVHGANGYLFTQFLAPADNPRHDDYGGDLTGRARLLRQTVRAVRRAVDPGFAVGVRISPVDVWAERGLVLDDARQLVRWLAEDGVDYVHLSLADARGRPPYEPGSPAVTPAIRDALPSDVALMVAGGIWTREDAVAAHALGADLVALGKAAIAHADWPILSRDPSFSPMRPPWPVEHLEQQAISAAFLDYLRGFRVPLIAN